MTGIEPGAITQVYNFDWKEGSDEVLGQLGENGAIVDADFADEHDLAVGDTVQLTSASNERLPIVIKAIYEPPPFYPLLGSVSIPKSDLRLDLRAAAQPVHLRERARRSLALRRRASSRTPWPTTPTPRSRPARSGSRRRTRTSTSSCVMLYVLLALSVIVSIFGMVNTLVLSVYERTRELGMLRAVGMTRRQVRRMVRHESVITALIGAALGLPLGIFLAALVTRALGEFDVRFSIPVGQLVVFAIIAVIVGHHRRDHAGPARSEAERPPSAPVRVAPPGRPGPRPSRNATVTGARKGRCTPART